MSRPVQLQLGVRNGSMWQAVADFDASNAQACETVMDGARLIAEVDAGRKFRVVTQAQPQIVLMELQRGVWISVEHAT